MASKLGISLAAITAAGAPVAGYFVYRHLSADAGDAPQQQSNPVVNLEPKITGSSYTSSSNFQVGQCSKRLFGDVDFNFKATATPADDFDLKWGDKTEEVEACLILHLKQQEGTNALAVSTELAAIQGNKGFVMWTVVLGKSSSKGRSIREEVRVVVLEKNSENKWEPKKGFSWYTKAGAGNSNSRGIKVKVTGTENKTFDNISGKLWEDKQNETEYKNQWTFKGSKISTDSEKVFSKLEITHKDNDNSKEKVSALFGNADYKISRGILYGSVDKDGKWTSNLSKSLSKDVDIPFKDIKGKWELLNVASA